MYTINEDLSIYATRGDTVLFSVTAEDDSGIYTFQPGDLLRMKVYGKKDAENVVMQKDFPVQAVTRSVEILLTEEDTKIGGVISKPTDYWYEIELNPYTNPQTIIGYDKDGPKVFKLFPEGDDIPELPVDPDVVKVMDTELDASSNRPVENRAITRAILQLDGAIASANANLKEQGNTLNDSISNLKFEITVERARIDSLTTLESGSTTGDAELIDARISDLGHTHGNLGSSIRANYNLFRHAYIPDFVGDMGLYGRFEHKWRNGEVNTYKDCLTIHPPAKFDTHVTVKPVIGYEIAITKYTDVDGTAKYEDVEWSTDRIMLEPEYYHAICVRRTDLATISLDEGYAVQFAEPFYVGDVYGDVLDTIYPLMRIGGYSVEAENVYTPTDKTAMYTLGGFRLENAAILHCEGDASIAFHTYDANTISHATKSGDSGWRKELTIPANTFGVLYFRKSPERPKVTLDDLKLIKNGRSLDSLVDNGNINRVYTTPARKGVAHRGYANYGEVAPENTLPAFRLAKAKGFDYTEMDVRITADGVPVICHDATVDRTSNGTGNVAEMTLEELKALDFSVACNVAKYAGTTMPSLEEALITCKNLEINAYLEIEPECVGFEDAIVSLVKTYDMDNAVTYISFSKEVLENVVKLDGSAPVALIVMEDVTADTREYVKGLRTGYNDVFIDARHDVLTNDAVKECAWDGIPVEVWTLDNTDTMKAMNPYIRGVTSEKTNYRKVMQDMELENV